jgi:hypothetical protein
MGKLAEYIAMVFAVCVVQLIFLTRTWEGVFSSSTLHLALSAGITAISLIIFSLAITTRAVISLTKSRRGFINPKEWYFDDETGEYHLITSKRGSSVLMNAADYRQRSLAWHQRANAAEKNAFTFCVFGLLTILFGKYLEFSRFAYRDNALTVGLIGLALIWVAAWLYATAERGRWDMVGPPPISPSGLDEVKRQKVYGPGGFATPEESDHPERGITDTFADKLRFGDWRKKR